MSFSREGSQYKKEVMLMKKAYVKPKVLVISNTELGKAYYGAMASSCCQRNDRCG